MKRKKDKTYMVISIGTKLKKNLHPFMANKQANNNNNNNNKLSAK